MSEQEEKATKTLSQNKNKLNKLAKALLEKETLEPKDINRLLKNKIQSKSKKKSKKRKTTKGK